ncbi:MULTISPECIES: helix-turn-helix domain-containing protein [Prevotella]|jgi:toxin-antitoxin system, antitoxin component, xre family|uniref:Helix-turn-helix transcriptional regulator n=1 Tax=Prevotella vespertina TaxID=2608404 RepID=A0A7C9LEF9_9BACT|nr:DNA-binding helix-turn-helix protein [Prevotella sp. oral taxon 306 str. F0472]MUL28717.1 helix-turn-helix transcriptional regulator [Prevotella vespertina]
MMKLKDFDIVQDELLGKKGTPERDAFEKDVAEAVQAYKIGEAIKIARKAQNLTQEELGHRVGVQKAQISRLEKGKSITFSTLAKVFKAMNIPVSLDMGTIGKVALW